MSKPGTFQLLGVGEASRSIRRNALWNLAGNGLPLLAGAVAIPPLLHRLGTEQFGIVTLIWTLIGYLSLFDFGLGRALTQLTAQNLAGPRSSENLALLRTAVYLTSLAGAIGMIALIALAHPLAFRWLGVSGPHQLATFHAMLLTALVVPVTTVSACLRGALEGHERFKQVNIGRLFLGISTFLFPAVAVTIGPPTMTSVVLAIGFSRLIAFAVFLRYVREVHPSYRFQARPHHAHRRELLTFGSWMTVSNVISPVLVNADRFVISGALGASTVAFYTVPFEIIVRLQIIPGALGSALFPRLASADGRTVRHLVRRGVLATVAILGTGCAGLVAGYLPVVSLWIGSDFARQSFPIAAILAAGAFVNGVGYVLYTAVQARSGSRATGILHGLELFLYLPVLLALVHRFGIIGAAVAWTGRVTLDAVVLGALYLRVSRDAL